jgi:Druantia protein DruA
MPVALSPDITDALTFSGRTFSLEDLQLIQQISAEFGSLGRTELSRTLCELLNWRRPSGRLKNHEARLLLERLEGWGWVRLPEVRCLGRRGPRRVQWSAQSEWQEKQIGSAGEFEPLQFEVVQAGRGSQLWREWVERYHYLGYRVPVGAHLRYLVRSPRAPLACLLWSSPAWKIAVRDGWIGWSEPQRKQNLQRIVNNARFLILPWVRVRGLASKILSHAARKLAWDWEQRYGYRPLLLETLVDPSRFHGTCYRAANWIFLGRTQGRGRMDRYHGFDGQAVKDVYVYPLCRNVQERLRTTEPPGFRGCAEQAP